jgi:hypothetical protein
MRRDILSQNPGEWTMEHSFEDEQGKDYLEFRRQVLLSKRRNILGKERLIFINDNPPFNEGEKNGKTYRKTNENRSGRK